MKPRDLAPLLHWTPCGISPLIREHHGFIDKSMGDGIMALQALFARVLQQPSHDSAAAYYREQAEFYCMHEAPPDWDGVEMLLEK